jgi:hypothetical protein
MLWFESILSVLQKKNNDPHFLSTSVICPSMICIICVNLTTINLFCSIANQSKRTINKLSLTQAALFGVNSFNNWWNVSNPLNWSCSLHSNKHTHKLSFPKLVFLIPMPVLIQWNKLLYHVFDMLIKKEIIIIIYMLQNVEEEHNNVHILF